MWDGDDSPHDDSDRRGQASGGGIESSEKGEKLIGGVAGN